MKCPDCSAVLGAVAGPTQTAIVCQACGGIWLDREELSSAPSERAPRLPRRFVPDGSQAGQCPRCVEPVMAVGQLAAWPAARCPRCEGVWVPRPVKSPMEKDKSWFLSGTLSLFDDVLGVFD